MSWQLLNCPPQFPIWPLLSSSWHPKEKQAEKLFIQSLSTPTLQNLSISPSPEMCIFFHTFLEQEFRSLSNATHRVNVVIYMKLTGAQKKKLEKPFWCCQRGSVALKGSSDVLWHLRSCMVLLRALLGHSVHHTLPNKTKTYLSLINTAAALKELPACHQWSFGSFVTFLSYANFFFFFLAGERPSWSYSCARRLLLPWHEYKLANVKTIK